MNYVQNIAKAVMTPPAFSNKVAVAAWAVSAITITHFAAKIFKDLTTYFFCFVGGLHDKVWAQSVRSFEAKFNKYSPYAAYTYLAVKGMEAMRANDTASMAALGVLAFGYFSSRNDVVAILNGRVSFNIFCSHI